MKRLVQFDINGTIRLRLSDRGLALHRADHDAFVASLPPDVAATVSYHPPRIDADGFWSTQAWTAMRILGQYIGELPFHPVIEIEVDV